MKNSILIFLIALTIIWSCNQTTNHIDSKVVSQHRVDSTKSTPIPDKIIEAVIIDISGSKTDSIILTKPSNYNDTGSFNKIIISISSAGRRIFAAKDIWDNVDSSFLTQNKNAVESKRVFVYKNKKQTLILLFGFIYGAGREEFSLIQIKDKKPLMLMDTAIEIPLKLISNEDGTINLLARNYGEIIDPGNNNGKYIETYSPFFIYTINDSCTLNLELTKKYNEEHYVWAGSTKYAIVNVLCSTKEHKYKIVHENRIDNK